MCMCFNDMGVCVARGTSFEDVRQKIEKQEQRSWDDLQKEGYWMSQPL